MSLFVRIDSHVTWELSAHMVRIFMHLSIDLSLAQKREDQRLHVVVPRVSKQDQFLEVSWECTRLAVEAEEPCQIRKRKLWKESPEMISLSSTS